jgi:hypothetical protein
MRPELVHVLTTSNEKVMGNVLSNMNNNDVHSLTSMLEFTDKDTERRWLNFYSNSLKYTSK